MTHYTYILYSSKFDRYYIGHTKDIHNRVQRHNNGTESATKPYLPWGLVWYTIKDSREQAMDLEKKLKNLSKDRIKAFIAKYPYAGPDDPRGVSGC